MRAFPVKIVLMVIPETHCESGLLTTKETTKFIDTAGDVMEPSVNAEPGVYDELDETPGVALGTYTKGRGRLLDGW
jgi:hypothetical protein